MGAKQHGLIADQPNAVHTVVMAHPCRQPLRARADAGELGRQSDTRLSLALIRCNPGWLPMRHRARAGMAVAFRCGTKAVRPALGAGPGCHHLLRSIFGDRTRWVGEVWSGPTPTSPTPPISVLFSVTGAGHRSFSASSRHSSGTERVIPSITDAYPIASHPKRSRILSVSTG